MSEKKVKKPAGKPGLNSFPSTRNTNVAKIERGVGKKGYKLLGFVGDKYVDQNTPLNLCCKKCDYKFSRSWNVLHRKSDTCRVADQCPKCEFLLLIKELKSYLKEETDYQIEEEVQYPFSFRRDKIQVSCRAKRHRVPACTKGNLINRVSKECVECDKHKEANEKVCLRLGKLGFQFKRFKEVVYRNENSIVIADCRKCEKQVEKRWVTFRDGNSRCC